MAVQLQMAHGHAAHHHVTALVVGGEVGGMHAAKVRKATSATSWGCSPSSITDSLSLTSLPVRASLFSRFHRPWSGGRPYPSGSRWSHWAA